MLYIQDFFEQILQKEITPLFINPTDNDLFELFQTQDIKSRELLVVLEELLFNSEEHGNKPIHFYFHKFFGNIMFAIEDFGTGIHSTLPENLRLSDIKGKKSSSILRLSLEEGITGTAIVGRGLGLFYLSKFVSENNAEALLASNSGFVIQNNKYFFEKELDSDINRNILIVKVSEQKVGL